MHITCKKYETFFEHIHYFPWPVFAPRVWPEPCVHEWFEMELHETVRNQEMWPLPGATFEDRTHPPPLHLKHAQLIKRKVEMNSVEITNKEQTLN